MKTGILEPVEFTDWASPIVAVSTRDNSVRICGDFKQTLNPVSKVDRYPIPKVEDLFASLSTTNLSSSSCINTHKGLYCYTHLLYGISSVPGRVMESILQGISGVIVYLLVTGISEEEHNQKVGGNTHKTREGWATLKEGQVSLQGAFSFTLKTQDQ